tara:strand:+ start:11307 stop:11513 length:207 start_codon:yes stop_codon:yes gene_type:complete
MTKRKVIEPLDMVRNIVNEFDTEIKSLESTIKYIQKEEDSETKETLLMEYKSWLQTMTRLREFVIYKA